jgi:uncharacterized membrane protein YjgN (DUF898 family)
MSNEKKKGFVLPVILIIIGIISYLIYYKDIFGYGWNYDYIKDTGDPLLLLAFFSFILPVVGIILIIYAAFKNREEIQPSSTPLNMEQSYFDGGLFSLLGWKILGGLITILTLGICYPLALCMTYGWETNHTIINGKRLHFNGKAVDLFLHWLLWWFLTIITLGIFSFWLTISLKKWIVKNTTMTGLEDVVSTPLSKETSTSVSGDTSTPVLKDTSTPPKEDVPKTLENWVCPKCHLNMSASSSMCIRCGEIRG